jgi:glycosyltransferase involved in cell wall biosynthesis
MIVKNEEENLGDALADVTSFADEIVVVDTGSVDRTVEIARRFTPNLYHFKWIDDFSAARNFAISKATKKYQLWLDADDRITPEHQGYINSLKSMFDGKKAFYFVLQNHQKDAPPSSCQQLRCTPLLPGIQFEGSIHEQIFPSAVRAGLGLVTTDIVIRHMGYMDLEARYAKARRNLEILEKERANGKDYGALYFYLALTHSPLGNKEEAIRCMEAALKRFENEYHNHHLIPEGYLFLARVSFELEEFDKTLRNLAKAKSLVEGSPMHMFNMGILYQRLEKHAYAIDAFRAVTGKKYEPSLFPSHPLPNPSELLLHIAYSYLCMNDRQNALKLVNASVVEGTNAGRSWEWLGVKAFNFKNIRLAQFAFETAMRFGALEPHSWECLGGLYELLGFSAKALECRKKADSLAA